jgi:hypothetical protein
MKSYWCMTNSTGHLSCLKELFKTYLFIFQCYADNATVPHPSPSLQRKAVGSSVESEKRMHLNLQYFEVYYHPTELLAVDGIIVLF